MTAVKISALPAIVSADALDADVLPIVSSYSGIATTYRITVANLRAQLNDAAQTFSGVVTLDATVGLKFSAIDAGMYTGSGKVYVGDYTTPANALAVNYATGATTIPAALTVSADITASGASLIAGSVGFGQVGLGYDDGTTLYLKTLDGNRNLRLQPNGTGTVSVSSALFVGTGVTTGSSAGDVVLANGKYLRGVNGAGSLSTSLIGNKSGTDRVIIDPSVVGTEIAGDVYLTLLGGGTHQVSVGAADSGGAGFKLLRVPN